MRWQAGEGARDSCPFRQICHAAQGRHLQQDGNWKLSAKASVGTKNNGGRVPLPDSFPAPKRSRLWVVHFRETTGYAAAFGRPYYQVACSGTLTFPSQDSAGVRAEMCFRMTA